LYFSTANFTLPNRPPIVSSAPTARIDIGDFLEAKIAAFKAHTSQGPLWPRFEENMRQRARQEMFHLAASSSSSIAQETDLFAGVSET
jgi:LmbE family N-acetylglucosaminyl deacetylase